MTVWFFFFFENKILEPIPRVEFRRFKFFGLIFFPNIFFSLYDIMMVSNRFPSFINFMFFCNSEKVVNALTVEGLVFCLFIRSWFIFWRFIFFDTFCYIIFNSNFYMSLFYVDFREKFFAIIFFLMIFRFYKFWWDILF